MFFDLPPQQPQPPIISQQPESIRSAELLSRYSQSCGNPHDFARQSAWIEAVIQQGINDVLIIPENEYHGAAADRVIGVLRQSTSVLVLPCAPSPWTANGIIDVVATRYGFEDFDYRYRVFTSPSAGFFVIQDDGYPPYYWDKD